VTQYPERQNAIANLSNLEFAMAFIFKQNRDLGETVTYGCSFLNFAINCSLVSLWAGSG
jgi:hypothetical protein